MSFEAHGSVTGKVVEQPVIPGGVIPPAAPAPEPTAPPPAPDTPPPAAAKGASQSQLTKSPTEDPATPPVVFTPNYKFKYPDMDLRAKDPASKAQKEGEIPEMYRALIKDAETEKQVKDLFEKAYGLDAAKGRFKETIEHYRGIEAQHQTVTQQINEIRELYKTGDMDGVFQKLAIPEEKILQWVIQKAQYNELPPDQRQVLDARKAAEAKARMLEKQQGMTQQQYEEQLTAVRTQLLDFTLRQPEVAGFAQSFESKYGEGSFHEALCDEGELAWIKSNGTKELSPAEAVQKVMAKYGHALQQAAPTGMQSAPGPQAPAQAAPPAAPEKKVIPNVAGRTSSPPAKSKLKSIDDIKKRYAEMSGA